MTSGSVLRLPDFRRLFGARVLAATALQVQAVVVGWQVWVLREDPLLLGLLGLTEAIPAIGCAFLAGHVVDRHRPAAVYRNGTLALLLDAVLLWLAVWPSVGLSTEVRLALLFSGAFVSGAARSFTAPAAFSLIPSLVPRADLASAAAWNSSSYQLAAIAGPAVGGLVYGLAGPVAAFAVGPVLLLGAWLAVGAMPPRARELRSERAHVPFVQSLRAGIGFALGHRVLLSAMLLDMFSVLFGGAVAVLPIFASDVFHVGSVGLGLLRAAPSAGSLVVAVWIAVRPMRVISGRALLLSVGGFGVSMLLFAGTSRFELALLWLALAGACDGVSMVIRSTLLQLLTPEGMRGRISALSSIFITSSNEIGAFESGLTARLLGLVPSVVLGGIGTLVVVATTALASPALRRTAVTSDDAP